MLLNYIKTALRNLIKYKGYSFINIVGLGFGVACFFLISLFVRDELSYDKFIPDNDRIHRVVLYAVLNNNTVHGAASCTPLAPALRREFPEVEAVTRSRNYGFPVFRYMDKVFSEERVFWADSTFFDVFKVEFIHGDVHTALVPVNAIVLTESMAKKYFGDENPIGHSLNADNRRDYLVTGVIPDVPDNSHFHYDFIASLGAYNVDQDDSWLSNNFQTYIKLRADASVEDFEAKVNDYIIAKADPQIRAALGITFAQFLQNGGAYRYYLQKITDIHLHSNLDFEIEPNGNYTYVLIFSIIAMGILLVACINFVNLSTARSANRAREVGIRKTVGSTRSQLIRQFLTEAFFLSFIAVLAALIIAALFLPSFNNLAGKHMELSSIVNISTIPSLIGLVLLIGLLAGSYPAFFMASFQPSSVMQRDSGKAGRRAMLRNGLVVSQFAISVILIIGTVVVLRQMQFIQSKDLGFNKDNVLVIHKTDDLADRLGAFKLKLREQSDVISVCNTSNIMGSTFGNSVYMIPGGSGEESHLIWTLSTDEYFTETFEIKILEGRYFGKTRQTDVVSCVLNATAAKELGFSDDPIGKELANPGNGDVRIKVIGVVEDFHFEALNQSIRPLIIFPMRPGQSGRFVFARVEGSDIKGAMTTIESTWSKIALGQAFEYEWFDDRFSRIFLAEARTGQILLAFSILAIIIASLGLFGLAAFAAEQRTKEIGIRKVMGASVTGISLMLVRQFTKFVLISNLIACPVAYFMMKKWLANFAYQAPLSLWIFIMSLVIALMVAVLTVSYQAVRAALRNPVDSLQYD
ncbi:ABC transporter permease [bacterium]|nr:ABC transporter permease [bacterium]